MAKIQIYKFSFLQNNPFGQFVTGDVLDIFVETDDIVSPVAYVFWTGVTVELNGVPLASSTTTLLPFNLDNGSQVYAIQNFGVTTCKTTTAIIYEEWAAFPWAAYRTFENYPSCAVNAPVCDLIVVGPPEITVQATETTNATVIINATSTRAIEYSLNTDFNYGQGQASNTFSLPAGDHRIYLRDEANCGTSVYVNVPSTSTYGVYRRYEYDDKFDRPTRVDIKRKDYVGLPEIVKGGGSAIELTMRGAGVTDKFEPMFAIQANVNLVSQSNNYFLDLYTLDKNLYRVEYFKDLGSGFESKWIGKLLPFMHMEEIKFPPFYVNVTATDGLSELSDYYLITPDGDQFYGTVSLIKIVSFCLKKIGLELPIRVGINMYADGMDVTDNDDPLDQAFCDYELFYIENSEPTLDFVLRYILKSFKARIIQWNGYWNILRVEELIGDIDCRVFDVNGDFDSIQTISPVKDVEYPQQNTLMFNGIPTFEMRPGYGFVRMIYKLGLKDNFLKNGNFRLKSKYNSISERYELVINNEGFSLVNAGYDLMESYETVEDRNVSYVISASGSPIYENTEGGNAYIKTDSYFVTMGINNTIKIKIRYKIELPIYTAAPYVKVRMMVKYGGSFLKDDGTWTATENIITFYADKILEYLESEIVAKYPTGLGTPESGMSFEIRLYHAYVYHADYDSAANLRALSTVSSGVLPNGFKTQLRDTFTSPSFIYYYELEDNTQAESVYEIIRPDDYNAGTNPRQWVLKFKLRIGGVESATSFPFAVDYISAQFLTDGKESIDSIIRLTNAEQNNQSELEEDIILGSYSSLLESEWVYSLDLSGSFYGGFGLNPGLRLVTYNILSADLVYAGWLRDSAGSGFTNWTRDGIAESDLLHAIILKMIATQYSKSWKLLRGQMVSRTTYFDMIDSLRDVNDSNRIYIPVSLAIRDFEGTFGGEFLELFDASAAGEYGAGFTKGFTTGFNA